MSPRPDEHDAVGAAPFMTVALVCAANVCRSPALTALLTRSLQRWAVPNVAVVSAGVAADAGSPSCSAIASETGLDVDTFVARPSRLLAYSAIDQADLILTASRRERGVVARMDPSSRSRTFTVLEALELDRTPVPDGMSISSPPTSDPRGDLAHHLHSRRAFLQASAHRGGRADRVLDIPDAHQQDIRHRVVAKRLMQVQLPLAQLLTRFAPTS